MLRQIRQSGQLSGVLLSERLARLIDRISLLSGSRLLRLKFCDRLLELPDDRDELRSTQPAVFGHEDTWMASPAFGLRDPRLPRLVTQAVLMEKLASFSVAQDGVGGNTLT